MLTEDSLTFKRAVEISIGMETAAKNVKSFQESDSLVVKQIASSVPRPHHSHHHKKTSTCSSAPNLHVNIVENQIIVSQSVTLSLLIATSVVKKAI